MSLYLLETTPTTLLLDSLIHSEADSIIREISHARVHTQLHGDRGHEDLGNRNMFPPWVSSPQTTDPSAFLLQIFSSQRGEKPKLTTQDAFEIL